MEKSDAQYAQAKTSHLKTDYQVEILSDWGEGGAEWNPGTWTRTELDKLHQALVLLSDAMGGSANFAKNLGGVKVQKANIGTHGGEALAHRVSLSERGSFSSWTVVHEFAHAWDANHSWKLSRLLEKYTGGFTNLPLAYIRRLIRLSDSGLLSPEQKPGRYGRWPGCNRAGYFYGDRPSGSNWSFNRLEDFAESVTMYIGWEKGNDLSNWAKARVDRYLLENGGEDKNFGIDNWLDYKRYFYPENGDYAKTKRWQFVDELVNGKIGMG